MRFHHNNQAGQQSRKQKSATGRRTGRRVRLTILGATVMVTVAGFMAMFSVQAPTVYARD